MWAVYGMVGLFNKFYNKVIYVSNTRLDIGTFFRSKLIHEHLTD